MKLVSFLVVFTCFFLGIFTKVTPPQEFVYKVGHENTEVSVDPNSLLILEFGNNSASPEQWVISNLNEITATGLVEFKTIQYRNDCETGCGETSIFTFEIKNVTDRKLLPILKFEVRSSSGNSMGNVNVTLNLTKEAPEIPEIPLEEFTYQVNKDTEIVVSSHSLIKIELEMDSTAQYEWLISNANEIDNSGLVEIAGNTYNFCGDKENCVNTATFSFHVKEIEEGDELPEIKFSYDDMFLWKTGERKITITLKREGELVEEKCQPKDGYPVCKTTKKVVYTDSDKWGVENNQWCIICN